MAVGMAVMMTVVVAVMILTGSFIQGFSTIAAPLTSMLRTSLSMESSISATQIAVEYNEVDGASGKWVKKLLKSWKIVKKSKKPQKPEKLQKSLVWRNVYQSTNPLSIGYEELKSSNSFLSSFCWAHELFWYHFCFDYRQSQANKITDALFTSSFYLCSARFLSATPALRCTPSTSASRQLENLRAPKENVLVQDQLDGWEDVEGIVLH